MSPALPAQSLRSTITDRNGVLEISIPLRFQPFWFLLLTVVCLIWGIALPVGVWKLITDHSSRLSNYFGAALFFVLWVVTEPMLLHTWATTIVGRDRVCVRKKEVARRREALGLGRWRRYRLTRVGKIEVHLVRNLLGSRAHLLVLSSVWRIDFGHGLDAAEAHLLAEQLRDRFARHSSGSEAQIDGEK